MSMIYCKVQATFVDQVLTKNFASKNSKSQLSNAVSRNVIRLLDQNLHCFKDKSYFSIFFEFYNNQMHNENLLKKVKIQIIAKSDAYIAQHRSARHLKTLTQQFNVNKILLEFSQHLLTKNLLKPEQAYLVLHIVSVCF